MAQEYKKFGMSVESAQPTQDHPDFEVNVNTTNTDQENPNPYGKAWFDNPQNMALIDRRAVRITSIPLCPNAYHGFGFS